MNQEKAPAAIGRPVRDIDAAIADAEKRVRELKEKKRLQERRDREKAEAESIELLRKHDLLSIDVAVWTAALPKIAAALGRKKQAEPEGVQAEG